MTFNKSAQNHEQTLNVFANGRIGELITEVIGNDTLQELFEKTPDFQIEHHAGKPSGIIALDLGIVSPKMKDALLVAQAAARTIAIVDGKMEPKSLTDDVFKFVGSDRDSQSLKTAKPPGWARMQ
jgi:formylmethanofuran:tetrahydromethanopterin formyltransferase